MIQKLWIPFLYSRSANRWINMSPLFGLACVGVLISDDAAISSQSVADDTMYIETKQPRDKRFITSITRLTTCKITDEADSPFKLMTPRYPPDSTNHHEEGEVIMQFLIDSDSCVRKATILQSSGYYRLDKASLYFAMNLKFSPAMLSKIRSVDDGQPTFKLPIVWKIIPSVPYDPEDRCTHSGTTCVNEAPPSPIVEVMGTSPEPGYIWMPGYYVHYPKTGYQWNYGQWEAPQPGYHWNAPHWERFRSKWIFAPGLWERDN